MNFLFFLGRKVLDVRIHDPEKKFVRAFAGKRAEFDFVGSLVVVFVCCKSITCNLPL